MKDIFYVEIPAKHSIGQEEGRFLHIKTFYTRDEAVQFCRREFGADEEGNICLISKVPKTKSQ